MATKSNLLLDVYLAIPDKELIELAVKCLHYENQHEMAIYYTGNFDDQEKIDGKKTEFGFEHYFVAGMFKQEMLHKFEKTRFKKKEEMFLDSIGNHLNSRMEDLCNEIKRLKGALKSQENSYESKLKEWRENHKQLTTAYNDLHYQYKQLIKKTNEKEMDKSETPMAQTKEN